jgi:hypothetical protein
LVKDGTLKQLDIELKRTGVQPTDELWQRAVGRILSDLIPSGGLPSIGTSISKWAKEKWNNWNPNYSGGSW